MIERVKAGLGDETRAGMVGAGGRMRKLFNFQDFKAFS
jgi:hypothetical protein